MKALGSWFCAPNRISRRSRPIETDVRPVSPRYRIRKLGRPPGRVPTIRPTEEERQGAPLGIEVPPARRGAEDGEPADAETTA